MAVYSSTIRYTGTSGIDTEGLVRSLMNAESMRYQKLKAQGTKLQWKQDAYRGVADRLKSFQSAFLSLTATNSLRSTGTFRSTTSSIKLNGEVSSAATIRTSGKTAAGKHTMEVLNLADKDVYVSGSSVGGKITGSTDLNQFIADLEDDGSGEYETIGFDLLINGKSEKIELSSDDITDIKASANKTNTMIELLNSKINDKFGTQTVTVDGAPVTLSKASFRLEGNKLQLTAAAGQRVVMAENSESGVNLLDAMGMGDTHAADTNLNINDTVKNVLKIGGATPTVFSINGVEISYTENTTVKELMDQISAKETGVKLSFDNFSQKFKLESSATGSENAIDKSLLGNELFTSLGLSDTPASHTSTAADAVVRFDGILTTSSTNNFNISDIAITVNSTTEPGKKLDIDVVKDTSTVLETIKKFVTGYNLLIEEMNNMTSQTRAKSGKYSYYEPLTDDEKEGLKTEEIEKLEAKAKEGILYRDDLVSGITSKMRSMMYESVPLADGKKISLYEIGITTSSRYQDKGKLEIDEEKLLKALEERPEDIEKLFTKGSSISKDNPQDRMKDMGIAERINEIIEQSASNNGTISQRAGLKGTTWEFTSDMYYKMKANDEKVANMLSYLTRKETYYYEMFSKMESAMTKANSQASYLASQMGG